jgi:hypothetical protein
MRNHHRVFVGVLVTLAGCGATPGAAPDAGQGPPPFDAGASIELAAGDRALLESCSADSTLVYLAARLAEAHLLFNSTLDPSAAATANAAAIEARIRSQLGACGTVTLADATVSVNFGVAPGCTLSSGLQVSGALTVEVTKVVGVLTARFDYGTLLVNGRTLRGRLSFVRAASGRFELNGGLGVGADALSLSTLTLFAADGGLTLEGKGIRSNASGLGVVEHTSVAYPTRECFPSSGTLGCSGGSAGFQVSFSPGTASTGVATLSKPSTSISGAVSLAPYGECP